MSKSIRPTPPLPEDAQGDPLFEQEFPVASSMECTGLIPAAPSTESEVDSYSSLYDIPLPKESEEAAHDIQQTAQPTQEKRNR